MKKIAHIMTRFMQINTDRSTKSSKKIVKVNDGFGGIIELILTD
jgi:hypothetical protein